MSYDLDYAAVDAGILWTRCPKVSCKAPAGEPCRTTKGKPLHPKTANPPNYHQVRLDIFWARHRPAEYRLPSKRGEPGAVLS